MNRLFRSHEDLDVFKMSFESAMKVFGLTKAFPKEERYSLVDQIRRSSRSVCANIAEAYRKRRYPAAFISKLSDAESESAETEVWLDFCRECGYLQKEDVATLKMTYERIIGKLVTMENQAEKWKP